VLDRRLRGPRSHHVGQAGVVDERIGAQHEAPGGATRRLHQLPKRSRYAVTGTRIGEQMVRAHQVGGARIVDAERQDHRRRAGTLVLHLEADTNLHG
jgi:hypothetical protein